MTYVVNNTRGQIIAVVQDGTINTTATSQTLVGKNVTPYGEYEVENLVHQLENFANSTAPGNPIEGQLWYNTEELALYVFSGTEWKTVSGLTVATTEPSLQPQVGELWFNTDTGVTQIYSPVSTGFAWIPLNTIPVAASAPTGVSAGQVYFNSTTGQLFVWDGNSWELIGPGAVAGFGTTQWVSISMLDVDSVAHPVIQGTVDGTVVAIISADSFTIFPTQRPAGFVTLLSGINLADSTVLNGNATSANKLTTARTINGVPFDGTANITIGSIGTLNAGSYLAGGPYDGSANAVISANASPDNIANLLVARNASGGFSAGTINAELVGNVSGTAQNVRAVVAAQNGGTGHAVYNDGEILIGNIISGLDRGTLSGTDPIQVTNTGSGLVISYSGGTGSGNVTSVGIITSGSGLGVSGSPITSSGNITLTNTGVTKVNSGTGISVNAGTGDVTVTNTGVTRIIPGTNVSISPGSGTGEVTISSTATGGGGGTVTSITAGTGITASGVSGGTITGSGTIAVDDTVIMTTGTQSMSGRKTFTGGVISQAYNFTPTGNSIFQVSSPASAVQIAVNNSFPHYFYERRFLVEGSGDQQAGQRAGGGTIVGIDTGVTGAAGVAGIHTNSVASLGVGVAAGATNQAFTGAVLQGTALRPASSAFIQIRAYSGGLNPVFVVNGAGDVSYDGTASSPAADYAEYFEWADGNPDQQDRVGISVALIGNKIKPAVAGDTVIGVVSAKPAVVGDAAELAWNHKYLTDEFGRCLQEAYDVWEWIDDEGKKQSVASFEDVSQVPATATRLTTDGNGNILTRPVLNPAYDTEAEYIPRSRRPEWDAVGLIGKLRLRRGQPTAPTWIKLRDISDSVEEWLIK